MGQTNRETETDKRKAHMLPNPEMVKCAVGRLKRDTDGNGWTDYTHIHMYIRLDSTTTKKLSETA